MSTSSSSINLIYCCVLAIPYFCTQRQKWIKLTLNPKNWIHSILIGIVKADQGLWIQGKLFWTSGSGCQCTPWVQGGGPWQLFPSMSLNQSILYALVLHASLQRLRKLMLSLSRSWFRLTRRYLLKWYHHREQAIFSSSCWNTLVKSWNQNILDPFFRLLAPYIQWGNAEVVNMSVEKQGQWLIDEVLGLGLWAFYG